MTVYQVRDWQFHFENDRSRQVVRCGFVCVPNKQSGMGLSYLLAEPDGLAIYGTFHLIIGACSQQQITPREGWLTTTGRIIGSPWTTADLSVKFRRSVVEMTRALEVLTSERVLWLQAFDTEDTDFKSRLTHAALTANSQPTHLEGKEGREGKEGKEGSGGTPLTIPANLETANFKIAWAKWLKCRRAKGRCKDFAALFSEQLAWLSGYDEPTAIGILSYSTLNDYQGLFPPKGYGKNHNNGAPRHDRNAGTANAGTDYSGAAAKSQLNAGIH